MAEVRKFTPLPDVNVNSTKVRFDLSFPQYVPEEQIGIRVTGRRGIEALLRWGGINHLRVTTEEGDVSTYYPTIVGHDEQGNAYAGRTGARRTVPTFSTDSQLQIQNHGVMSNWINATIRMNIDEIGDKISHDSSYPEGVRSPSAWAKHLNKALKNGITQIGLNNVLLSGMPYEKVFGVSYDSVNLINSLNHGGIIPLLEKLIHLPVSAEIAINFVIWNAVLNTFIYNNDKNHLKLRHPEVENDPHFSLFYAFQLDRAAILATLAKTTTLAKALPQPSQRR